jgi:hypothetical protein
MITLTPRVLRLILVSGLLAAGAVCCGIVAYSVVDRAKASEAFIYASAVEAAQERYHIQHSVYANHLADLDLSIPQPKYYTVGKIVVSEEHDTWTMALTRGAPDFHTVVFNQDGAIVPAPLVRTIRQKHINPTAP